MLVMVPVAFGFTVTVALAELPAVIVPSVHVTVVVPVQPADADTKVAPGKVSATCTPVASLEPVLVTVRVYVTFSPTCTGSGEPVTVVTSGFWCCVRTRISSMT